MNGTVLVVQAGQSENDSQLVEELEGCGFTVLTAEDPNMALFELADTNVDVVVVDSLLSQSEELGMQTFLQELGEKEASPPFILVSSSPDASSFTAKWGAAAFLAKPCQSEDLKPLVHRMMSGQSKRPNL